MENNTSNKLTILDIFKNLTPKLSIKAYDQLEKSLSAKGCIEPICVWNGIILDGHNRYEICIHNKIPYRTVDIQLKDTNTAMIWICKNELRREDIAEENKRYLIGKRYEVEKSADKLLQPRPRKNQYTKAREALLDLQIQENPPGSSGITSRRLGAEYSYSYGTIMKYGAYAQAIDIIMEINPDCAFSILSGAIKISQNRLVTLAALPKKELCHRCRQLIQDDKSFVNYSAERKNVEKNQAQKSTTFTNTIKNMPAFDPDAEIVGLTLTIPSWINSIKRTKENADLQIASNESKKKLAMELDRMINMINIMLTHMKE